MKSIKLNHKKVVISAGASGIGWATTKVLASQGAVIYLCDLDQKAINKVKKHSLFMAQCYLEN